MSGDSERSDDLEAPMDANESILRDRAARLADAHARVLDDSTKGDLDIIVVARDETMLGFPIEKVVEVREVRLCPLPHTPPQVSGLFAIRGNVYCAVDVQPLLGDTTPPPQRATSLVVVVRGANRVLGVRADSVDGNRKIPVAAIDDGFDPHTPFLRAVTSELVSVVDVDSLINDSRFYVGSTQAPPASNPEEETT